MTTVHAAMRTGYRRIEVTQSADRDTIPATSHAAPALDGRQLECVAVHPDAPRRVFVGTFESGVWRSTDGGETFERLDGVARGDEATGPQAVMSLAVAPDDPETVWLGTEPSRVFVSRDGGETWDRRGGLTDLDSASEWSFPPRPHTHHVRWLEPDPADADHWYVAVEAGALVQTDDGGVTWRDRVPGSRRDTHSIATHPDAPGRAWVAAGDGFAETHDGGATWHHPQRGLDRTYCWSVAVDAADPSRVLVSAARSAREAHTASRAETYVYRREEGGDGSVDRDSDASPADGTGSRSAAAWERLDESRLPVGEGVTRPVLARGSTEGLFFALSNRGLWRTTDGGDSWWEVGVDWPDRVETQTARGLAVLG